MNLADVQKVTGGELLGPAVEFNSVSIDSRSVAANDLFVAISGPNFNGNKFVQAAADKHAVGAIVTEQVSTNLPMLKVKDGRIALGVLGALNRQKSSACVIALTGSQGKTTVKEMTAAILSGCGEVVYTQGNLNNDYGVPLSLLKINAEHEFAVIELGASGPDEIAYSVELTRPKIAHITNVADTHIEGFGDIEGVANAKSELWGGIEAGGIAVINIDDTYADKWKSQVSSKKIVTLSAEGKKYADYFVSAVTFNDDLSSDFVLVTPQGSELMHIDLPGQHNVANALAAAVLSMEAGATLKNVQVGLTGIKPVVGRLCHRAGINGASILDDSYNASPASFKAAIDVLAKLPGTKIIAIGDMGELGGESRAAHIEIGRYAKASGIDCLFSIGDLSQLAVQNFSVNKGNIEGATSETSISAIAEKILPMLSGNVTVLVKGSRSAGMDKLVKLLLSSEG